MPCGCVWIVQTVTAISLHAAFSRDVICCAPTCQSAVTAAMTQQKLRRSSCSRHPPLPPPPSSLKRCTHSARQHAETSFSALFISKHKFNQKQLAQSQSRQSALIITTCCFTHHVILSQIRFGTEDGKFRSLREFKKMMMMMRRMMVYRGPIGRVIPFVHSMSSCFCCTLTAKSQRALPCYSTHVIPISCTFSTSLCTYKIFLIFFFLGWGSQSISL